MKLRNLCSFVLLGLFANSSLAAGTVRVGGGAAPINNIFRKIQEPFQKASGITLTLSEEGPDQSLKNLDEGKLEVASAGLSQAEWLRLMDDKKIVLKKKGEFLFQLVGRDILRVVVHPNTHVTELDKDQLRKLFSGQITNWKDVGGSDTKVIVVVGEKISGTNQFFKKSILNDSDFVASAMKSGTAPEALALVKATPGAVTLAPMGLDTAGVSVPKIPELGRPIYTATVGRPSEDVRKLLDFIRQQDDKKTAP